MREWLFPFNAVTFQKYFWFSQFSDFKARINENNYNHTFSEAAEITCID